MGLCCFGKVENLLYVAPCLTDYDLSCRNLPGFNSFNLAKLVSFIEENDLPGL